MAGCKGSTHDLTASNCSCLMEGRDFKVLQRSSTRLLRRMHCLRLVGTASAAVAIHTPSLNSSPTPTPRGTSIWCRYESGMNVSMAQCREKKRSGGVKELGGLRIGGGCAVLPCCRLQCGGSGDQPTPKFPVESPACSGPDCVAWGSWWVNNFSTIGVLRQFNRALPSNEGLLKNAETNKSARKN